MVSLNSPIHLQMLRDSWLAKTLPARIFKAIRNELRAGGVYGLEWGDPDVWHPLKFVRDRYVLPYVKSDQLAVEIGPGGGRWTRYLLGFKKLYVVDYHAELLRELRKNFSRYPQIAFIQNHGTDFPGIEPGSIDFVFSFGTFVHLDLDIIEAYLDNIRTILKPTGNAVIHYSDKAKIIARENPGFSDNTVEQMRAAVTRHGFRMLEEDTTTMWHSSLIRFALA